MYDQRHILHGSATTHKYSVCEILQSYAYQEHIKLEDGTEGRFLNRTDLLRLKIYMFPMLYQLDILHASWNWVVRCACKFLCS